MQIETLEARQLLAADLHVNIATVPSQVRETEELSYVVSIRNDGADDALDARIQIPSTGLHDVKWSRLGPTSFPSLLESGKLDGNNGLTVRGNGGRAIGDVNGDQVEDWVFSDFDTSTFLRTNFVVFGGSVPDGTATIGREDLDGKNGFSVEVSLVNARGAGDLNGDGFADMFVGDRVAFGHADIGASGELRYSDTSFSWRGITGGASVSAAGDFNGDGFDDVAVSDTSFHSSGGGVWIVYGKADLDRSSFQRITRTQPIAFGSGVYFSGDGIEDFGTQVAAGDFNNDGFSDIVIGTSTTTLGSSQDRRQRAYLVLGSSDTLRTTSMPRSIEANPTQNVILFYSDVERPRWGPVGNIFDINSDGFDDVTLFGNYVVFGNAELSDGFAGNQVFDVALLNGSNGFHTTDRVSAAVDINGDGKQDLVSENLKQTYLTFGGEASFLSGGGKFVRPVLDGNNGFQIDLDEIQNGAIAGDFNNDGKMDLAISNWTSGSPSTRILFGTAAHEAAELDAVNQSFDLPAGVEITYVVTGTVPLGAASPMSLYAEVRDFDVGPLRPQNMATSGPINVLEVIPNPEVDLVVALENDFEQVFPFDRMQYTINIENRGVSYAIGANVVSEFDDSLSEVTWTRTQGSRVVGGVGAINEAFNLAPGEQLTYLVTGIVDYQVLDEFVSNVTVTTSEQQTDVAPSNNMATERETAPLREQQPRRIGNANICYDATNQLGSDFYFGGWNGPDDLGTPCFTYFGAESQWFHAGVPWKTDGTFAGTMQADGEEIGLIREEVSRQVRYRDGRFELQLPGEATWSTVANVAADPDLWRAGPLVADDYLIYSQSAGNGPSFEADLFALDLEVDFVDAGGPYRLEDSMEQTTSYATQVIHWSSNNSWTQRPGAGFDEIHTRKVATDAVLGNSNDYLTLVHDHEITVTFPQDVIDLPGNDIVINGSGRHAGTGDMPFKVHLMDGNGRFQFAGTNREIDLSDFDIVGPVQAIRIMSSLDWFDSTGVGTDIQSIQANVAPMRIVLTADATNNLDLQYGWDLNADGNFGDRIGKSVGLTEKDLLDFGFVEPGEYPITVRMTDRVHEYFDTTTLTIPSEVKTPLVGDIDLDGQVAFSDFLILSANFGKTENASASEGDLNEDGRVTFDDFLLMSANFGAS